MGLIGNFFEFMKDLAGVLDDAGDYVDRIRGNLEKLHTINKKVQEAAKDLGPDLDITQDISVKRLKAMRFSVPRLFGRTIIEKLRDIQRNLQSLKKSALKAKGGYRTDVLKLVEGAENKVASVIAANERVVAAIDRAQKHARDTGRNIAKLTGVVVGSAVAAKLFRDLMVSRDNMRSLANTAKQEAKSADRVLSGYRVKLSRSAEELGILKREYDRDPEGMYRSSAEFARSLELVLKDIRNVQ